MILKSHFLFWDLALSHVFFCCRISWFLAFLLFCAPTAMNNLLFLRSYNLTALLNSALIPPLKLWWFSVLFLPALLLLCALLPLTHLLLIQYPLKYHSACLPFKLRELLSMHTLYFLSFIRCYYMSTKTSQYATHTNIPNQ